MVCVQDKTKKLIWREMIYMKEEMSKLRSKRLATNTCISVVNQVITIASGFILPRYMLYFFGSEINGLVSSITQFLAFISLMQAGVGAVVQASLYKPLSNNDFNEVSKIYVSAQKFFRMVAVIFAIYTVTIGILYPCFTKTPFTNEYVFVLVLVISINLFAQYYFGLTNLLLLNSDQKAYIPLLLQTISTLLNICMCVAMMNLGYSVLIVKFASNIICLITPIGMMYYVKKNYNINTRIKYESEPIPQKWSGFVQHISAVVVDNTDVVVLTIFSSLSNVSVYGVYYMIVNSFKTMIISVTAGIQALFGDMIARCEKEKLDKLVDKYEIVFAYIVTVIYSCVMCLIVPFISVYTKGISDAKYNRPMFGMLMAMAFAMYGYRTIYYIIIKAAGHFKETQSSAIIEVIINIFISILCVKKYGIIGVAIGTLLALVYRTVYCAWYLSKNIIYRKMKYFLTNLSLNIIVICVCYFLTSIIEHNIETYAEWLILSIKVTIIVITVSSFLYIVVYRRYMLEIIKKISSKYRKEDK